LGWGNYSITPKRKHKVEDWNIKGNLICPDCGEDRTHYIQTRRCNYYYCDKCGYENDVDYWYKQDPIKANKRSRKLPKREIE
jgi:predicted RNA-binding Zn-ribbon protein involved in translation (DUF1610 family)